MVYLHDDIYQHYIYYYKTFSDSRLEKNIFPAVTSNSMFNLYLLSMTYCRP